MNDLLKNKHAVSLNVTEEELANMCPAAAETSRFLKGGATLTGLVRYVFTIYHYNTMQRLLYPSR